MPKYGVVGLVGFAAVTAIVLVLVGVGVVGWLRPHNKPVTNAGPSASRTSSPSPSRSPSPSVSPSVSPSTKPSTKPSSKPSTKPSTKPSSKPTTKPTSKPTPSPTVAPPPNVPRDYPVVVLNETRITGLAARVAASLRDDGWTVKGVGNWIGNIPETTVYYPDGTYSRAQKLAADLGVTRIRPRVPGMLTNRLTVVLHDPPPY